MQVKKLSENVSKACSVSVLNSLRNALPRFVLAIKIKILSKIEKKIGNDLISDPSRENQKRFVHEVGGQLFDNFGYSTFPTGKLFCKKMW